MDDMSKILEEIDTLKKRVQEMQKSKHIIVDDDCVEEISKVEGVEDTYNLTAVHGYNENVDLLCRFENTGNGYIAYFPSYLCSQQDNYICMDYAEADYIRKLLNYIHMEGRT